MSASRSFRITAPRAVATASIAPVLSAAPARSAPSALALATLLAAALAGCAVSTPAPVLLIVPSAAGAAEPGRAAAAAAPAASGALLSLGRVEIPEYMVARRVRYRADLATLAEWSNTYWGERIEIGVAREFTAALHRRLPGWAFCETDCAGRGPTLGLRVDIARLDYLRAERRLEAHARVSVVEGDIRARPLRTREIDYRIAASADTPQAEAEAIAALVDRIAVDAAALVSDGGSGAG